MPQLHSQRMQAVDFHSAAWAAVCMSVSGGRVRALAGSLAGGSLSGNLCGDAESPEEAGCGLTTAYRRDRLRAVVKCRGLMWALRARDLVPAINSEPERESSYRPIDDRPK